METTWISKKPRARVGVVDASEVQAQLSGKRVLLTGATGFLGKVVLEKLLRSVPDLGAVELLIRDPGDGSTALERFFEEVATSSVFERLEHEQGPLGALFEAKVCCLTGDVSAPLFGLSRSQFDALARRVDAVVHCAAAVRFQERLDVALAINTLGLRHVAGFARAAGGIPVVQVSTCFVNGTRSGEIAERNEAPEEASALPRSPEGFYRVADLVRRLQRSVAEARGRHRALAAGPRGGRSGPEGSMAKWAAGSGAAGEASLSDDLVEMGLREARRHGFGDTYTFTKWLGEQVALEEMQGGTLTIVRPSIVESALAEPAPGWIEGVKVSDAVVYAYARGKLSRFPGREGGILDLVPADLVANAVILSLGEAIGDPGHHRIYQACSGSTNPITLRTFFRYVSEEARTNHAAYERLFRRRPRRCLKVVDRRWFDASLAALSLPLLLLEQLRRWVRLSRPLSLLRKLEASRRLAGIFAFYAAPTYVFRNDRLLELAARMGEADRALFPVDPRGLDWEGYLKRIHLPGLDRYALRERDPSRARRSRPRWGRRAA